MMLYPFYIADEGDDVANYVRRTENTIKIIDSN